MDVHIIALRPGEDLRRDPAGDVLASLAGAGGRSIEGDDDRSWRAGHGDTDVLRFWPVTTFSIRTWAEPSRFAPNAAWLKGSRLSLSILNITNKRQRVTDDAGLIPLVYQRGYRDPLGRTVEIEFRNAF